MSSRKVDARYPLAPLASALGVIVGDGAAGEGGRNLLWLAEWAGVQPRQVARWRADGIREPLLDGLADRARIHPYVLWPEYGQAVEARLTNTCADPYCQEPFIRTHHSQKYCSPECQRRTNWRDSARRRYQADEEHREAKKAASRAATRELWANGSDAWKRRQLERQRQYRRAAS